MAIARDAETAYVVPDDSGGLSISFSHTVAGSDRYLLVGMCMGFGDNTDTMTAPTYNSAAMTHLADSGMSPNSAARVRVWGLIAPATGAHSVACGISTGGDGRTIVIARSYTGVHQTTPVGTATTATGESTTISVAVSSAVDELVSDFVYGWSLSTGPSVGAGQTEITNTTTATGTNKGASSDEAGASTVTMSWTLTPTSDWATVGVPIKPAGASYTPPVQEFVKVLFRAP